MKDTGITTSRLPIHVLLADDDSDDRYFFERVIQGIQIPTELSTVQDGEKLMAYLNKNSENLPDVIFVDQNMPKKNGFECLLEIKQNQKLKHLPVVIYSTSLHDDAAEVLFNSGAYHYVRKTDMTDLKKYLKHILGLILEKKFIRPTKDKFILSFAQRIAY